MEELILVENNESALAFKWNEIDYSNLYNVYLIDSTFNFYKYKELDVNFIEIPRDDLKDYIGLKVEYIYHDKENDKKLIVYYTKPFLFDENLDLKTFELKAIKSYKGIAVGFITHDIYDEYRIYKIDGDKRTLYKKTEDYLISGEELKENDKIVVEAYKKENNNFVIKAITDVYTIKISEVENKKKKPAISIIVPVYNSEAFISRCADSVLLSTFNDVELLLINDGSKDSSLEIITWYQDNYPSIVKVTDKENEGVSFTRNKGIDLAIGDYITFIDNDDMVHPYMYEELYKCAVKENTDVTIAKTIIRNNINAFDVYMDYKPSKEGEEYFIYDYETMTDISENGKAMSIYFVAIWNKLIKSSIAKGKYFDKQNYYEDQAYTRMIYSYCDSFAFCLNAYYVWDKRIQKTKGTQSNRYIAHNEEELHTYNMYVLKANLYGYLHGNPERKEQLADLFVRDAYDTMKNYNYGQRLYEDYRKVVIEIDKEINLKDNKYLKKNEDAYNYIMDMLKKGK